MRLRGKTPDRVAPRRYTRLSLGFLSYKFSCDKTKHLSRLLCFLHACDAGADRVTE